MVRPTRFGNHQPILDLVALVNMSGVDAPSGSVLIANGSNGAAWGSNVQVITSNSSNALIGPFVNFASGTNIAFAAASNTLTIIGLPQAGGGGGGGAPTTAQYVTLVADGALSAEKVRADLYRYHPDNAPATAVAVGHEFNDAGHNGFSWAASDPATNDVATYPGYLVADMSSTVRWYNKAWTPGASDITIACAIDWATIVASGHIGLYVGDATGNDPQDLVLVQLNYSHNAVATVDMYNRNAGAFAQIGGAQTLNGRWWTDGRIYLRLTRLNSGPTWTAYHSFNGIVWVPLGTTGSKSLTVGSIGLRCTSDSGAPSFAMSFIRGWSSIVSKIGS